MELLQLYHSLSDAVFLLEGQILLEERVDTINHGLHKFDLGVAKAMFVGDVIGDAVMASRFAAGTTGLEVECLATLLQCWQALFGPSGQVDVDGGAHSGAEIGGARVQVTEARIEHEFAAGLGLDGVTDGLDTTG